MRKDSDLEEIQIRLSRPVLRILRLWAKFAGRPLATFVAQIVTARAEANIDVVDNLVVKTAKAQGIEPAELERQWLDEEEAE